MKRTLFFWIDKLQISRSERIILSVLMCITMVLSTVVLFFDFSPSPDDYKYEELETVFYNRSVEQKEDHEAIMARYAPAEAEPGVNKAGKDNKYKEVKNYETSEPEQEISDTTRININTADAEELQQLPGIGPAYAGRIIEWRKVNGDFESVDQLLEIRGIGEARLENIRPYVIL